MDRNNKGPSIMLCWPFFEMITAEKHESVFTAAQLIKSWPSLDSGILHFFNRIGHIAISAG